MKRAPKRKAKTKVIASVGGVGVRDAVETAISLSKKRGDIASWDRADTGSKGRFARWEDQVDGVEGCQQLED